MIAELCEPLEKCVEVFECANVETLNIFALKSIALIAV